MGWELVEESRGAGTNGTGTAVLGGSGCVSGIGAVGKEREECVWDSIGFEGTMEDETNGIEELDGGGPRMDGIVHG
ncbi:hypothetical protein FCV25MIE_13142 [Fagus crenata]